MEPTLTPKLAPYLLVKDARGLIRFMEQALGGTLTFEVAGADGIPAHAEVRVSDGVVMLAELPAGRSPSPAMIHLYVADADDAHRQALKAGATSFRTPATGADGDHRGGVRDAWGNEWWFTSQPRNG